MRPIPPGRTTRLRSRLDALIERGKTPGIQFVAVDASGILFEYDGGRSDIHLQRPMEAATTLMAYSMSKTVTAVAVLQLVQSGKLGLDDRLDATMPSSPYGPEITIRELLSHTSGVPNPIPLRWVHPAADHAAFDDKAALDAVLLDNPRLSSAPGSRYAYSNIGYWLLGRVVEAASDRAFPSYVTDAVLGPLGLTPSEMGYSIADPGRHATGYLEKYSLMNIGKGFLLDRTLLGGYEGSWLTIRPHFPNGAAFGGLVGTARGFAKLLRDQLRPSSVLLDEPTRALLYARQRTKRGRAVPMTLGWHFGGSPGTPIFYKEGGGGGFHALMRLYPSAGLGTVLMTNATGFDVTACLDALDSEFLG
jgi:CubicO group peptidase (beta-lactamase class C family)